MSLAGLAGIVTAGAGIFSAISGSKKADSGLAAQMAEMARIREENKKYTEDAYSRELGIINTLPSFESLLGEGGRISDTVRKDLLDFTLGDSQDSLRSAQGINADLANFDFTSLDSNLAKILRSSQFDIASISGGDPIGSIANLSVANMVNFAQQGLSNSLQLGDFFSRTGQTDRFNPYAVATDLYKVKESQANSKIGIEESRVSRLTDSNNNWAGQFADISNAQIANQANKYQGISNAIAAGFTTYSGMSSAATAKQNANTASSHYGGLQGYLR